MARFDGKDHLHRSRNQRSRKCRYDFGDLGSVHEASNHETKGMIERGPTIHRRNRPPYDKRVGQTSERWDSRRRRVSLYQKSLPSFWCGKKTR